MPDVMIRCPVTGKPVRTGMSLSRESLELSELEDNRVGPCPHCGQTHVWDKEDAYLESQAQE